MNLPYGSWKSPLSATELTRGVKGFADLQQAAGALFLLESRPEEGGRSTLVMLDPAHPDNAGTELTPSPLNVRSRVHEYGGGAFLANEDAVYFVNFTDQNIYVVAFDDSTNPLEPTPPKQLTFSDANRRYADFSLDTKNQQLLAVCELHKEDSHEPQNLLVSINLASGEEHELHTGHDFYASPRVARHNNQIAFVAWDHPNMPWDHTLLYSGSLLPGAVTELHAVVGPNTSTQESVSQPLWLEDGKLLFASDRNGFWNLYVQESDTESGPESQSVSALHNDEAEYASPGWIFGLRETIQLANGKIATVRQAGGLGAIHRLSQPQDQIPNKPELVSNQFAGYHALCCDETRLYAIADQTDGFACLIAIELATGETKVLRTAGEFSLTNVAKPEAFSIKNRSGLTTHAWLYLPCPAEPGPARTSDAQVERQANAETAERPPLIVLSHGGPTSSTSPALNPRIQYYTSRGWAVADVNYGGSTGYGRAYRERLRDNWGLVDVHDCEDIALALASSNRVDAERLAIKGGSAGGYTTLAALTFGDVFSAGASHYGIGDLDALAAETHKFEARYVDGLIPAGEWQTRSPIHSVDSLSCPVIFFQGADDAVVPPSQAQAMVNALQTKGLPVAYVEFAGEGHGFRQAKNIQHAAAAEYQFFCRVFGIECPDDQVDLVIENLDIEKQQ